MEQTQLESIQRKAGCLAGEDLGEDGALLVEMAAQRACAWCQREDIPVEMEQAVAALALQLRQDGLLKSLTRGDTSFTFEVQDSCAQLLSPFRRLGRLKEDV